MKKIFVIGWTLIPAFTFSACSGIALLGIEGANSAIGLWHYRIGIIASVISTGHMLKRLPLLRKQTGLKQHCCPFFPPVSFCFCRRFFTLLR